MTRDFSNTLRISEIFYSIQGESTLVGLPTVFIRLTGCPLRCQYCDTDYAFSGGDIFSIDNIIGKVQSLTSNKYITVTGGEPLAQKACANLLVKLLDLGYKVSLETSGAFDIKDLDPRVIVVMDIKTPDSKESDRNLWSNLKYLKDKDQIKFVICSHSDYVWAKDTIKGKQLDNICEVLLSPSYNQINIRELADNILKDHLPVRLQSQLHKQIWDEEQGR